jgi:ribosomal protein L19
MFKNNKTKNPKLNIIKTGQLVNVKYLIIKNDELKILSFVGLCVSFKKKSTICLKNVIKKEAVSLIVNLYSPMILKLNVIRKYKKRFRLNKIYYK